MSTETDWKSAGKTEDLWRREVGLGYSTVVVQDGRAITMGYDKDTGLDSVWCLDAQTGEVRWRHTYPSKIWNQAHEGGTVNTPTFDGDVVYSLNREGNFYCLDVKSGEVRWHTILMPEGNPHELEIPTWGFSASPLVVGEHLYLNCGRLLAIEKSSGKVLWRSNDYGHGYGTPIAFDQAGTAVLAAMNGKGLGVVRQKDGSEVGAFELAGKSRGIHAATPVLVEDGTLFVSAPTVPTSARIAFGEDGLKPVWNDRVMINSFSGCVRVGQHLYGFDGQVLACLDLDGKLAWSERGIGNGAVFAAGDRLLIMGGNGELITAKASPAKYESLASAPLFEAGRYWTKPILANGIVYCRSSKGTLVARDHRTAP